VNFKEKKAGVSDWLTDRVTYFRFKSLTIHDVLYCFKLKQKVKRMRKKTVELLITFTENVTPLQANSTKRNFENNFIAKQEGAVRAERLLGELAQRVRYSLS